MYCNCKTDGYRFSIFLNFFDVISKFFFTFFIFVFYVLSFYIMSFLYFCFSMFCRSMFRHRPHNNSGPENASKIVNEYDQEIPQSRTADNPVAP